MTAPATTNFSTLPTEGIDFTVTYTSYDQTAAVTSTNSPDNPGPPFAVGTHALGSNGTEYIFVKATNAVEKYSVVAISNAEAVTPLTLTLAQALTPYGFAQVAIAASAYGWVAIRGENLGALARLSSLKGVAVYISSVSAGRLSTTSVRTTSGGQLVNVVLTTSSTVSPSGAVVITAGFPGYTT